MPVQVQGKTNRVSISLKTRCPKEALRLAKALEYHSAKLTGRMDLERTDYKELTAVYRDHFAKLLKVKMQTMDEFGALPRGEVVRIKKSIKYMETMIADDTDWVEPRPDNEASPEASEAHKSIMNIAHSGFFTSDRTIENYNNDIWHLKKINLKK